MSPLQPCTERIHYSNQRETIRINVYNIFPIERIIRGFHGYVKGCVCQMLCPVQCVLPQTLHWLTAVIQSPWHQTAVSYSQWDMEGRQQRKDCCFAPESDLNRPGWVTVQQEQHCSLQAGDLQTGSWHSTVVVYIESSLRGLGAGCSYCESMSAAQELQPIHSFITFKKTLNCLNLSRTDILTC